MVKTEVSYAQQREIPSENDLARLSKKEYSFVILIDKHTPGNRYCSGTVVACSSECVYRVGHHSNDWVIDDFTRLPKGTEIKITQL